MQVLVEGEGYAENESWTLLNQSADTSSTYEIGLRNRSSQEIVKRSRFVWLNNSGHKVRKHTIHRELT